jgi:paraquat-inducible protein B
MIQRSNPRVIGGFVLGALALLAAAVLVFGRGEWFKNYERAVIFFQGSVGGLRVGAPVDFRGVQIGSVHEISIQYDFRSGQSAIPVVIDIDPSRVRAIGRTEEDEEGFPIDRLVERGLRAELRLQSFVTGQMAVQLNFRPGTEIHRTGSDLPYPEIPTVPSTFEQAQEILTELAAQAPQLISHLNVVLDRAQDVLTQFSETAPTIRAALTDVAKFSKALGDSEQQIRSTLTTLSALSRHADSTVLEFDDTGKRLNRLLADNGPIKTMLAQFTKAGAGLTRLVDELSLVARDNREGLKDFSSSGLYDLTNLIRDTQDLVGNLNRTIDELRRNPSQFLFGQQRRDIPTSRAKTP